MTDIPDRAGHFTSSAYSLGGLDWAVPTEQKFNRLPYAYQNLEFFQSRDPAIYTPAYPLK